MFDNMLRLIVYLMRRERCPWCGCVNFSDDVHRDACPTLDTCGQFGPPWVLTELHPDDPKHPVRDELEPIEDYHTRCSTWNRDRRAHLHDAHGIASPR